MEPEVNWAVRLPQVVDYSFDMHIPPDITFQFENDENEIDAHKWMMGMVSPVFNKMFFVADTKDRHAKKLLIKGTTFGAFNITKNALYGITSMEKGLKGKSVFEVFSVLDLVTRYQISELQKVVKNHLASFPLTEDTVLEVAANAMEKSSTFVEEAKHLLVLVLCARFIKSKLKTAQAVYEYIAEHEDEVEIVYKLMALMKDVDVGPDFSAVCKNCRQEPCQNGADVGVNQFREGIAVTSNDNEWWNDNEKKWGKGIVTEVLGDYSVRVKNGEFTFFQRYEGYVSLGMIKNNKYTFKFCCQ